MIVVGLIQVLILLVALLRAKALALLLGPEGVGVIGTIDQLVVTVTHISALGIPYTAMKFMSAARGAGADVFRDVFAAFARLILLLALAVLLLGVAVVLLAPGLAGSLSAYRAGLLAAAFSVPATLVTILIAHTFAAAERPGEAAIYNLAFAGTVTAAALTGAVSGGIAGFYIGAGAAGFAVILAAMLRLRASLGLTVLRKGISIRRELTERPLILRTALAAYVSLVSASALLLIVRYVVIESRGEAGAGFLQAALAVALSVGSILATLNSLYLAPSLNRIAPPQEKFDRAAKFSSRIVLYMALGGIPVALFPGLALSVLYTTAFVGAGSALVLCLIWQLLFQLNTTYAQLLIGIDRPLTSTLATLLSLPVGAAVVFLLAERWGELAAPVALIVAAATAAALMILLLVLRAGMPVPWAVLARFAWVAAAIAGAAEFFDPTVVLPDLSGWALRAAYALITVGLTWLSMHPWAGPGRRRPHE